MKYGNVSNDGEQCFDFSSQQYGQHEYLQWKIIGSYHSIMINSGWKCCSKHFCKISSSFYMFITSYSIKCTPLFLSTVISAQYFDMF